jgi:cytochrome c
MKHLCFRIVHTRVTAWYLIVALAVTLAGTGCSAGSYPLDIFQEMHYHQSQKYQEPDRLDSPSTAIAFYDRKASKSGQELYIINCAMCHGASGNGDGTVLVTLKEKYDYKPIMDPDLTSASAQGLPDQAISVIVSNGLQVMPTFKSLLSVEERLLVIEYVRQLQQRSAG